MGKIESQPIKINTVSDSVYLWIKNAIIVGDLKPGQHLVQDELTETLGVSRTPVRDAFKRLEAEGLIINRPYYGVSVFQPSKEQLHEIYDIRILVEQYCATKDCHVATDKELMSVKIINEKMAKASPSARDYMQLDYQFHKRICEISKCSKVTLEILESLWNKCSSFKSLYFSLENRPDNTIRKHREIAECLIKRDEVGVKNAIADHLHDVVDSVINVVLVNL
jgi:DNA-binding GntR family transcriptional regulator